MTKLTRLGRVETDATGQRMFRVASPTVAVTAAVTEEDLRRNDAYIMHHVQHTALNSSGMLPFVKMVTYEKAETAQ